MSASLSLVIPAYNEGRRLGDGLDRLHEAIDPGSTEVIVVDDGSSDDTAEVARRQLASWPDGHIVRLPCNRGKGAAVKEGVIRARGELIAFVDADMATDPGDLVALLGALDRSPVAVGCRAHRSSVVEKRGLHRTVMNRTFGMLVASLTRLPYTDTQCGFKAFRAPVAKLLFHGSHLQRFAFDVEVLDLAARLGLQTEEVAVHWTDISGSHVRPIRDGLQMLGDVARIRLSGRAIPPVPGVLLPEIHLEAAQALIRPRVRKGDLMVHWGDGTAVLFPCVPPTAAQRISARLMAEFESHQPEVISVAFAALIDRPLSFDVPTMVM